MTYKTIFKGRLEFGSAKSYDKVLKMYQHRVESYYKSDILLNEEEIFDEASSSLNVPQFITQGSEKSWKNTISLLEYVAQFAVAGRLGAWMTAEGRILHHDLVEPKSDRVAVQAFLKGRSLSEEEGRESEAMAALSKAIEKYERHAQAYERRGYVNLLLKNYEDALYDYTKSIDISKNNNHEAYFGRANVNYIMGNYERAIEDFSTSIKMSIPLQPLYWKSRRLKAECHLRLNDPRGAMLDMRLFCKRAFKPNDPNFKYLGEVHMKYGKVLLDTDNPKDAVEIFQSALAKDCVPNSEKGELLYHLAKAKKACGKPGFKEDFRKAASLGYEAAIA
ncbi:MAG: tetratricopeptide repeat protein [Bacteroidota bacterium]